MTTEETPSVEPKPIHADLQQRACVRTTEQDWTPSPQAGVERKFLDRKGGEVARATSLVRFAPGGAFREHEHRGGEEFLVLEGTFCDELGAYPAGTYVRNPPGTRHTPFSPEGCTILVKLLQMQPRGEPRVVCQSRQEAWQCDDHTGILSQDLFIHPATPEKVRLEYWPVTDSERAYPGGVEYFVLEGCLKDDEGVYPAGSWLRLPPGSRHTLSCPSDARVWVKQGHLA